MNGIEVGLIEKELCANVAKEIYFFCFQNKPGIKLYVSNYGAAAQSLFKK
jgi:hypothetical protein